VDKLQNRAVEKKKEEEVAAAEEATRTLQIKGEDTALEDVPREERLGPGGLDPVEVFESLPTAMQEAFESGSIDKLREYVNGLPMEDAKRHMKRMVDSGLWVPAPGEDPGLALR
jgi:cell division cycle protein 37